MFNSLEPVQGDEALVGHISTRHHLHRVQTLLQVLYGAQPLQAGVLDVHALVELDFLHVFQTILKKKKRKKKSARSVTSLLITFA